MVEQLTRSELQTILEDKGADADGDWDALVARLAQLDVDGSIVRDWLSRHDDENTRDNRIFEAQTRALLKRESERLKNRTSARWSDDDDDDDEPERDESELAEVLRMIELQEILGLTNRPIIPRREVLEARLAKLDVDGSIVRDWLAKHNDECTRKCRILEAQQDADWRRECRRLDRRAAKKKQTKKKKVRAPLLSDEQLEALERQFAITRYPNLKELGDLEAKLGLVPGQVERWFDDRRELYAKMKKRMERQRKRRSNEKKKLKMKKIDEDVPGELSAMSSEETAMDVEPQPSTSRMSEE